MARTSQPPAADRGDRHAAAVGGLLLLGTAMLGLLLLLELGPHYEAEIRRTAYGIPHIRAGDWAGLGYGYGYAYAEDNACLLAERLVTVRGERSRYFGPDHGNFESDVYHRAVLSEDRLERLLAAQPRPVRALVRGFATGFGRALRDPTLTIASSCRGQSWLGPPTERDLYRHLWALALTLGSEPYAAAIARASPPGPGEIGAEGAATPAAQPGQPGSNAYALGAQATGNGRGLLLANPHLAWSGVQRLYPVHLTIPGTLDVMGASLQGVPAVLIGFNRHLAWTGTVSTAHRATLYQLQLVPGDPTAYRYQGEVRRMQSRRLQIPLRDPATGTLHSRWQTVYFSHHGPVLHSRGALGWTTERAFSIRDANLDNSRFLVQFLHLGQAGDLDAFATSLQQVQGVPWSNTLAVDAAGEALYADVGVVPNVPDELLLSCRTALGRELAAHGLPLLDGSREECEWRESPRARQPGIMPATELPLVRGRDYYANANDSPWLSNPESPLLGYPQVLGEGATPRSLRTRLALDQIRARLAGSDGRPGRVFDRKSLAATFFDNRSLGGELLLEDLLAVCATLSQAPAEVLCAALAAWDRRNDLDSRGSHAFKEVLQAVGPLEGLWRVRFDPSSPLDTPRGLAVEQPQVAAAVARALVTAAGRLTAAGVDPGAPLGDVQYRKVGSQRIPIHGGSHRTGAFNVVEAALTPAGYTPIAGGSSFILVVGFEGDGPRAEAGLSHSLSSDPSSPHYSDLTRLYSEKRLLSLPFREAEIRADPGLRSKRLRE